MCRRSFLKQCLVKLFNLRHIHINAEQAFDLAFFIQYPVGEGADMADAIFTAMRNSSLKGERDCNESRITFRRAGDLPAARTRTTPASSV